MKRLYLESILIRLDDFTLEFFFWEIKTIVNFSKRNDSLSTLNTFLVILNEIKNTIFYKFLPISNSEPVLSMVFPGDRTAENYSSIANSCHDLDLSQNPFDFPCSFHFQLTILKRA